MEADVVCAHGALVHHGAPEEAVARRPSRRGVPSDACATWQAHGRHPVHGGLWGRRYSLKSYARRSASVRSCAYRRCSGAGSS